MWNSKKIDDLYSLDITLLEQEIMSKSLRPEKNASADVKSNFVDGIEQVKTRIAEVIDEFQEELKRVICEKRNYCENIKNDRNNMIGYLIDCGILFVFKMAIPPLMLAVYIVRLGYLDKLCKCSK